MVSVGGALKTSNGNFMMHGISRLFTDLAFALGPSSRFFFGGTPSTSTGVSSSSRPPRMVGLTQVRRLPLGHAGIITERFFSMKIACRPYNIFTAKIAFLNYLVGRFTTFIASLMITKRGTIKPVLTLECLKYVTAGWAYFLDTVVFIFKSWHGNIIVLFTNKIKTIEIEEKYCEIAVKKLGQGVLAF